MRRWGRGGREGKKKERTHRKKLSLEGFDLLNYVWDRYLTGSQCICKLEYLLLRCGSSISWICSGNLLHRRRPGESARLSRHSKMDSSSYSAPTQTYIKHETYCTPERDRKAQIKAVECFYKCECSTCVYLNCISSRVLRSHVISVSQKRSGQFSQQVIGEVRIINPTLFKEKYTFTFGFLQRCSILGEYFSLYISRK